jgi:hypothetical protein
MSNNFAIQSKSGGIFRLEFLMESSRMMKIENDVFLSIAPVWPSWPPTNTLKANSCDAASALIVFVLKQLVEGSGLVVISEAEPVLECESTHKFLKKRSFSMQVCLRSTKRNMNITLQGNGHFVECTLELVNIGIQRNVRQVVQHSCEAHVNRIRFSEVSSKWGLEGTRLERYIEKTLCSGLHNPVILPQVIVVYERCVLLSRGRTGLGAWV